MPLPLPNLDTRRWADLVEEGRALIPRYAPQWSDHNIHDPGMTLIELFAWLIEADIYRTNRVPPRHRRKFLQLIGFAPRPPQPARAIVRFTRKSGKILSLPSGLTLVAGTGGMQVPFRLLDDLSVIDTEIAVVQSFNGKAYTDQTRAQRSHFSFAVWGNDPTVPVPTDPEAQPALYLGLSEGLPPGQPVKLWLSFAGSHSDRIERLRIMDETQAAQAACRPLYPKLPCPPMVLTDSGCQSDPGFRPPGATTSVVTIPPHHSIRTAWDYWDGSAWQALDRTAGYVADDTRGFTLDGSVTLKLPTPMGLGKFGPVHDKHHYLRARLVAGMPDDKSMVSDIDINAAEVEQATSARGTFVIRPGVLPKPGQEPEIGKFGHLGIELDKDGAVTKLAFGSVGDGPKVRVVAYVPAKPAVPGILTVTLVLVGRGTGLPGLKVVLPDAPVVPDSMRVWTISNEEWKEWGMRPDLDASGRTEAHFVLAPMTGEISFGDGERGRVVPLDAAIVASCDITFAGNGNVPFRVDWRLANADDEFNRALLGADPNTVADAFRAIENPVSTKGGADEEDLDHAAGRAAESVWAHERLLDLRATSGAPMTLDGLDRNTVLARVAPQRAATLVDYERLSLDVPGAPVARARAWDGLDPEFPRLKAPGTVVVIVVPWLPAKRPMTSPALIEAVQSYLDRRRLVGTRLVVVGPHYLEVTVRATLALSVGARSERVLEDVQVALDNFLDPLSGGPEKRGWPFGRDVYRSEILEVIDNVAGVDYVENLELVGDASSPQCGNLCVGPLTLATPGSHALMIAENFISKGGAYGCTEG